VDDTAPLVTLIGDIHDAALEPTKWLDALAEAARFVGGSATAIHTKAIARSGVVQNRCEIQFQYGLDPAYQRLYVTEYAKIDPSTSSQLAANVGDVVSIKDCMPYDEFQQSRFYKEWACPQQLVDAATAILQKTSTDIAVWTVFRHQRDGRVNDEMRERMQWLIPHLRRAMHIGKRLDRSRSQADAFADALDRLCAGVFFVDAAGDLIHANAAARAMLSAGCTLSAANSRLLARDPAINELLRDACVAAGSGKIAITTRDGDDYVAHVLPLSSAARWRSDSGSTAVAVIFLSKAGLATCSSPELIAQRYKLTPAELRVVLAIFAVGGVPEVAHTLGVSVTTVKTHLERVYQKTGTNRQVDLVRLVVGFASPVADAAVHEARHNGKCGIVPMHCSTVQS
jgi:DNA-binding CsgD family transcriptional regulator/PAS domain-containing protein